MGGGWWVGVLKKECPYFPCLKIGGGGGGVQKRDWPEMRKCLLLGLERPLFGRPALESDSQGFAGIASEGSWNLWLKRLGIESGLEV